MHLLDRTQLQQIEGDVEKARLTLNSLAEELIDHICCEVERIMREEEKSFEEAYALVKKEVGIEILKQIQENTYYLIDKNYALMKTIMKITGNVSLALLSLGTVMKIFHWPGATILLLLGFTLLSFVFFPAVVYINHRDSSDKKTPLLYATVLLGGILLMLGVFFKVMHWPHADALLLVGWILVLFVFLPFFLMIKLQELKTNKEKEILVLGVTSLIVFQVAAMFKMFHWPGAGILLLLGSILLVGIFLPRYAYYKYQESGKITGQFIFLVIGAMNAVVLTALLSLNISSDVLFSFVLQEKNDAKLVSYYNSKTNGKSTDVLFASDTIIEVRNVQLEELSKLKKSIQKTILSIKIDLIQTVENVDNETALQLISNPDLILDKKNIPKMNEFYSAEQGRRKLNSLGSDLVTFIKTLEVVHSSNPARMKGMKQLLLPVPTAEVELESLKQSLFNDKMLIHVLSSLTSLEKNILLLESMSK